MKDERINPDKFAMELGTEFYLYSGPNITTLRAFCKERNSKYFHYKEVMDWASEDWEGKHPKTNEKTIFKYRGGYCMRGDQNEKCLHVLFPVSMAIIPKDVLKRNIDKGYFVADDFTLKLLNLNP